MTSEMNTPQLCPHCGKDINFDPNKWRLDIPEAATDILRKNSPWLFDKDGKEKGPTGIEEEKK